MRRCCCGPGCVILRDTFSRSNSTNISDTWVEESGNVSVTNGTIQGTGSFLVRTTHEHTTEQMVVTATMRCTSSSLSTERYRVLVNYLDTNNYLYVQMDFVFSGVGTPLRTDMRFFRRSGGVDTQLGTTKTIDASNVLSTVTLKVCYDGVYLSALTYREAASPITNGRRAGFAYSGSLVATFDDFVWTILAPDCPNCSTLISCGICPPGTSPSDTLVVDFGVGGWTDVTCTNCDQVVGDVVLAHLVSADAFCERGPAFQCQWVHQVPAINADKNYCFYLKGGTVPCFAGRCIRLGVRPTANPNEALWELFGSITAACGGFFGYEGDSVFKYSLLQSPIDCGFTSLILTKVFESHIPFGPFGTAPCAGTLPATVEIRQVI